MAVAHGAPAALAEPAVPVRRSWIGLLFAANLGLWMVFFTPVQVLLPQQIADLGVDGKEAALGWVTGLGALVAIMVNPLAGAFSDRSRPRIGGRLLGRRHVWTARRRGVSLLSLLFLSGAPNLAEVAVGWAGAQFGLNIMLATLTAAVPDRVPVAQRGLRVRLDRHAAGARPGARRGAGHRRGHRHPRRLPGDGRGAGRAGRAVRAGHAGRSAGAAGPAAEDVLADRLPRATRTSPGPGVPGSWSSSATRSARCTCCTSSPTGSSWPTRTTGLLIMILLYTLGMVATAVIGGRLSDRSGRRKIFVVWSGVVIAIAALLLAIWPTWPVALVAAVLLGAGYGVYLAVDTALITQVLPAATDRAKDLGVINIATAAPQVLGPAIAAPLVTHLGGYPTLYAVTAVVTLLGAVLVLRIRSVP